MKAERKQRVREFLRSVRLHALTAATACFFATATTGCVSHPGGNAVIESHFTRLEQSCFGYEPTVWRTMTGQCDSAVRQIPEPVIRVPQPSAPTPTPETAPKESILGPLPEPGESSGLFQGILGPTAPPSDGSTPPTEPAPGTEPMNGPAPTTEPAPGTEPADGTAPVEPPATEAQPAEEAAPGESAAEPAAVPEAAPEAAPKPIIPETTPLAPPPVEPTTPPPAEPPAPQFSFSSARTVKVAPADRAPADRASQPEPGQASTGAANNLFRTLESALGDTQQPARSAKVAPKKGSSGLAKFISY